MKLVPGILKKETLAKAYAVLERYQVLCNIAEEDYLPKLTATYSLEPRGHSWKPSSQTESMVARRVDAQAEVEAIRRAVDRVSDSHHRQVIIEKYYYGRNRTDIERYMDLGYSESEFYRLLERAVLEFAENYRNGRLLVFDKDWEDEVFGRYLQDIC